MKYFEAGTFEKMRQAGLATPNDFIEMLKDLIARYKITILRIWYLITLWLQC